MRLHLGANHWPGFVNSPATLGVDEADEIHAIHHVERIPRMQLENRLMDWHRALKRGGKLVIETPCLNKIAQHIIDGEKNLRMTVLGIFGDPRKSLPHEWAYTREELTECLLQSGFANVCESEARFHHAKRDMRLEAVKP